MNTLEFKNALLTKDCYKTFENNARGKDIMNWLIANYYILVTY